MADVTKKLPVNKDNYDKAAIVLACKIWRIRIGDQKCIGKIS
jgi:hypothetical protein